MPATRLSDNAKARLAESINALIVSEKALESSNEEECQKLLASLYARMEKPSK